MHAYVTNKAIPIGERCSHASHKNRARAEYVVHILRDDSTSATLYVCPKHVVGPMAEACSAELDAFIARAESRRAAAATASA